MYVLVAEIRARRKNNFSIVPYQKLVRHENFILFTAQVILKFACLINHKQMFTFASK
jgi:hypothetical protein